MGCWPRPSTRRRRRSLCCSRSASRVRMCRRACKLSRWPARRSRCRRHLSLHSLFNLPRGRLNLRRLRARRSRRSHPGGSMCASRSTSRRMTCCVTRRHCSVTRCLPATSPRWSSVARDAGRATREARVRGQREAALAAQRREGAPCAGRSAAHGVAARRWPLHLHKCSRPALPGMHATGVRPCSVRGRRRRDDDREPAAALPRAQPVHGRTRVRRGVHGTQAPGGTGPDGGAQGGARAERNAYRTCPRACRSARAPRRGDPMAAPTWAPRGRSEARRRDVRWHAGRIARGSRAVRALGAGAGAISQGHSLGDRCRLRRIRRTAFSPWSSFTHAVRAGWCGCG